MVPAFDREPRRSVDIVTDDMPFLVDSVTMELARHDLDSDLIVHPQLLVRRDVAGALREVVGPLATSRHGTAPRRDRRVLDAHRDRHPARRRPLAELEKDLQRVLHDVRVAVEDYSRMQAKAVRLADRLAAEEGPRAPAETQALLRWLADNHFTFLGYREYDLVDGPDGMALRRGARHRPGHPAARPARLERRSRRCRPRCAPGPGSRSG